MYHNYKYSQQNQQQVVTQYSTGTIKRKAQSTTKRNTRFSTGIINK